MNKTPISILHEIMAKQNSVPTYELIHDGGGTHINTFTYQVICDGLIATGTGRCKKDAKHEAANAMLEKIAAHRNYPQLPASPTKSPIRTPLPDKTPISPKISNEPFINAIGDLQTICAENNLQAPEYNLISDVGPPHARIFTFHCVVSNFIEVGVGTTKKQARHEAAKKMMDKINNISNELNCISLEDMKNEYTKTISQANENAETLYLKLSKLHTKKINLGVKLTNYHTALKDSLDEDARQKLLEGLNNLTSDNFQEVITDELVKEKIHNLESLLSECDISILMKDLEQNISSNMKKKLVVKAIQVNTCPSLVEIGIGKIESEACFKALSQIIDSLKLLLL